MRFACNGTKPSERFDFELPYPLPTEIKGFTDVFKQGICRHSYAKAHAHDQLLTLGQELYRRAKLIL